MSRSLDLIDNKATKSLDTETTATIRVSAKARRALIWCAAVALGGGVLALPATGHATTSGPAAVNAGGPALAPYVADTNFSGGATLTRTNTIDLSGVVNPAPMAVYQSQRYNNMTYTFSGFAPGASNEVRLHWADTKWTTANQRTFNVTINGTAVLNNFDIIGAAGAPNKAVARSFTMPANASGAYVIQFVGTKDAAMVCAIEVKSATPSVVKVNAGGAAASPFVADTNFSGGSTVTRSNTIDLSAVSGMSPAPAAVYQSMRFGNMTYTFGGYTVGSTNTIRLHFCDTRWTATGLRKFNVTINGTQVLSNFDIVAEAGAGNKAKIVPFTMAANSSGAYVIQFTTITDQASISGIEIINNASCGDLATDTANCGRCANACPAGNVCALGMCMVPNRCQPSGAIGVLVSGTNVDAYVPNGSWATTSTGIRRVPLEGTSSRASIGTSSAVNSCASNSVTGTTVCAANGTSVYVVSGAAVATTVTSGATATQRFPGGSCQSCSVAIDAVNNRAALSIGLTGNARGGFQFLDLATNRLGPTISSGGYYGSEGLVFDSTRQLLLSPNEFGNYQVVDASTASVFSFSPPGIISAGVMDSAAVDCSTGVALSSLQFGAGRVFLVDLTQASLSGSLWKSAFNTQTLSDFSSFAGRSMGVAVAPGSSHLGVLTGNAGAGFGVIRLPSTGGGQPAITDWVSATLPNDPQGAAWAMSGDPHLVSAYVSPSSAKAFAVMSNAARTFVAVVDMDRLLAAARQAGTHRVSTSVNLLTTGIVKFVSIQ